MAVSTTQSIWRSGGGDQSRTAYCGSGVMAASFWVANAAAASSANVVVSSAAGAPTLVLPQGAVVLAVFKPKQVAIDQLFIVHSGSLLSAAARTPSTTPHGQRLPR